MNYKDRMKTRHNKTKRKRAIRGRKNRGKGRAWAPRKKQKGTRAKRVSYLKGQGGSEHIA